MSICNLFIHCVCARRCSNFIDYTVVMCALAVGLTRGYEQVLKSCEFQVCEYVFTCGVCLSEFGISKLKNMVKNRRKFNH